MPFTAATDLRPECADMSSSASRVSLVNLQKFTLKGCELEPSMKMLAPAQKTLSLSESITSTRTSGCSKRSRWIASASSRSTPRS